MSQNAESSRMSIGKEGFSVEKARTTALVRDVDDADDMRLAELGYRGEFKREFSVSLVLLSK